MRSLHRNRRELWYSLAVGAEPILDEYGNDTLEVALIYEDPVQLRCNVSANAGQAAIEVFGAQTEYSRTITIAGWFCPLAEGTRIWLNRSPDDGSHNYEVVRVADSKNGFMVALREVTLHA